MLHNQVVGSYEFIIYKFHQSVREIVAAVRSGGGPDPKTNARLAQAVEKARLESVPKVQTMSVLGMVVVLA